MPAQTFANFFTRASAGWCFNSAGVLTQAAANAPRFDYDPVTLAVRGLLVEEARTNIIRNSSMAGAGPGVSPTFWGVSWGPTSGVSWTFVGTGTENGIPYIDLRLSGTASAQSYLPISIETPGALTTGQAYTLSGFIRLVAGSLSGGTYGVGEGLRLVETRSSGGTLYNGINLSTLTGAALASQRFSVTKVIDALTTSVSISFQVPVSSGQTIDATFRFGAPQLELGALASSPILTTSAQVTRSADLCSLFTGAAWFNSAEGTLYAEFIPSLGVDQTMVSVANVLSGNDSLRLRKQSSNVSALVNRVGGTAYDITSSAVLGGTSKIAAAFKSGDQALCLNGGAVATSTNAIPSPLTNFIIGGNVGMGASPGTGWLRDIRYYPRRLSNAELQALTT